MLGAPLDRQAKMRSSRTKRASAWIDRQSCGQVSACFEPGSWIRGVLAMRTGTTATGPGAPNLPASRYWVFLAEGTDAARSAFEGRDGRPALSEAEGRVEGPPVRELRMATMFARTPGPGVPPNAEPGRGASLPQFFFRNCLCETNPVPASTRSCGTNADR